ncbi:hypothetical protein HDU98_004704 [Podochytrium sp. JEL0797]|nr:hypothetical protein HDU98_004704 [Podochytrium sp. JEL0797]
MVPATATPRPGNTQGEPSKHNILRQILQRLPGVLVLLVFPYLMFMPYYFPALFSVYYGFLMAAFLLFSTRSALGVMSTVRSSWMHAKTDWVQKREHDVALKLKYLEGSAAWEEKGELQMEMLLVQDIFHVIVIPNYKESIETLTETLDVLASHELARSNYKVCLAMEETEDKCEAKALVLLSEYAASFHTLTFTVHPKNLPGEIRGKSSNTNWACTQLYHRFSTTGSFHHEPTPVSTEQQQLTPSLHEHIYTCIDADTCFAADYFTTVAYEYTTLSTDARKAAMFIPSLLFDRNSQDVNPLVRVMDLSWSASQMSYFLPHYPFRPATSAYSVPMELASAVGFWDTSREALGEDYHMTIKCTFATSGRLRVIPIFSPASQFNICGDKPTFTSGIYARIIQLRRHMWGSLDLGYTLRMGLLWLTRQGPQLPATYFSASPAKRASTRLHQFSTIFFTLYSTLELFIWSTHAFIISLLVGLFVPNTAATPPFFAPISKLWWALITGSSSTPIPPIVLTTLRIGTYFQMSIMVPMIGTFISYELYYRWNATYRWTTSASTPYASKLGARPGTISPAREWWRFAEWVCYPISAFATAGMLVHTTTWQLFTDRLDYKVAGKPVKEKREEVVVVGGEKTGEVEDGFLVV